MSDRVAKVRQGQSDDGGPDRPSGRGGSAQVGPGADAGPPAGQRAGTSGQDGDRDPSADQPGHDADQSGHDADESAHGGDGLVVAVTGAARGLGEILAARLARSGRFARVVAIDDHRGELTGVTWRMVDIRDPVLAGRLAGIDVVVHLDLDLEADSDPRSRRAYNVRGTQTVLTAAAAGGVGRVVIVTSAMVYGARPENPVPLAEAAPLGADLDGSVVGDFLEIEQLAERAQLSYPGMAVTVVRPAALVGPGIDTLITRHFESPRLLAVKGCAPRWQFCYLTDLMSALELAAAGEVNGSFAVGCAGWLDQEQVEELSGLRRIELPKRVTFATAQRLNRAGITRAPVTDLHYVVYPWVVDCETLRRAGWQPSVTNAEALQVLLQQRAGHHAVAGRRLDRKDATITAAGATVAVIGTAAIVHQVRKRRRDI